MAKLAPTENLHSLSPLQNTPTHKTNPRNHSTTSLSFAPSMSTSLEAATPTSPLPPSPPNSPKFQSLHVKNLNSVKAMHAQMIKTCNSNLVAENLLTSYLEVGDFRSASVVFFVGFSRNYAMWSDFLEEFESFGGDSREVLEVFRALHCRGVAFDSRVITLVLKMCNRMEDSWLGLELHASLIKRGFELDVHANCALMNFYASCWDIETANQVFCEIREVDDLSWNEAIILNLKNERWSKAIELFRAMKIFNVKANNKMILRMVQACGREGALNEGKQIHGYVLKHALESNLSICNSLVTMYSRNDKIKPARKVFDSMQDRSLASWNSMISSYSALGYLNDAWDLFHEMESSCVKPDIMSWNCLLSGHAIHGFYEKAVMIFRQMQVAGFRPNSSSITSILQAVTELKLLNLGKEIHGYVLRNQLFYDVYVGTSLLDMYVKNDCLTSSRAVFDNMESRNIVSWNSLISGYSFKGLFDDTKRLLHLMEEEGNKPDLVTWNSLISGYSMWGKIKEALNVIDDMKRLGLSPNVISWTALISGSSQNGNYMQSFDLFVQMQRKGIKPNFATISSLLRTCGGLFLLHKGKEIHCLSTKNGFIEDVYIVTALIDMYSKSGDVTSAYNVFRDTQNKSLASWNCMIMGFSINGFAREAFSLFGEMQGAGVTPDAITFTALLSGCKNSGLVDEGWKYFDSMSSDYGIKPTLEHYSCMVDLLGRAGYLDEAWDFIQTMPLKPDATVWGAFLGSCRIHRNIHFAEIAAKKLFKLEPYNSANYVLMMNLYAMSNRWKDAERTRDLMTEKGVTSRRVWSWIQIDQSIHVFSSDKPHGDVGQIYFELYQLVSELKKFGYVPDISGMHQNMDDAEKQKAVLSHTEKLAITYGLIKAREGVPIRVIKNTRICSDCHAAAKLISLVRKREVFLRDGVRFHHFKDGKCSCNDYW